MGRTNQKQILLLGQVFALAVFSVFAAPSAQAYVRSLSQSGGVLYWPGANVSLVANPTNSSGMALADVGAVISSSIATWKTAETSLQVSFDSSVNYSPRPGSGRNTVAFSTASGQSFGYNVIGVTELTYYVSSGQIASVDITFNDRDFIFTGVVGDTGQVLNGKTKIFLGDVMTHELGHAWGLDHSNNHRSTLIYTAFSGEYQLGSDDRAAIRTLYPASGVTATQGSIVGSVRGTRGGIFGAHVSALNLEEGRVEAGTLSSPDGTFRIGDIPPGKYAVMVEPLLSSVNTISLYYANIDHRFCSGGRKFRRNVYSSCSAEGSATSVGVVAGAATQIGYLAPSCDLMDHSGSEPEDISLPREIPNTGGGFFTDMNVGDEHFYRITNFAGDLDVKALSYTLFSPLDVVVEITDLSGTMIVGSTSVDDVQNPMPGGYTNYDSSASATGLPLGDYLVKVKAKSNLLFSSLYPAGGALLDSSGFYFLSVGVNHSYGLSQVSDMSACVSVNNTQQSGLTFASSSGARGPSSQSGAACGSLAALGAAGGRGDGDGANQGMDPGALNFALVFVVAFAAVLACRLRRKAVQF